MKNIIIITVTYVFLCYGCSNRQSSIDFDVHQTIQFHPIEYDDIIGIPLDILKIGDDILIADFHGDSLLSVFNMVTGRIHKMIPVGKGPGEAMSPIALQQFNNLLFVQSRGNQTLYHLPLTDIHINSRYKIPNKLFTYSSQMDMICPLTDFMYLASYKIGDFRYAFLNDSGHMIKSFGAYPDFWEEEKHIPSSAKFMFHQSKLLKHPEKPVFASVSSHIFEIWEFDGENVQMCKQLALDEYKYRYQSGDIIMAERYDTSEGVRCVCSTSKYIYMVYKDKDEKTSVRVFDWKGEPVKCLHSDKDIDALFVDEELQRDFCIVDDSEPMLMYFDM